MYISIVIKCHASFLMMLNIKNDNLYKLPLNDRNGSSQTFN